jgi:hypothetical protein
MTAVTLDWLQARTQTKTSAPLRAARNGFREEVLDVALDSQIADLGAHWKPRYEALGVRDGVIPHALVRPASLLHRCDLLLKAICEVWQFSHDLCRDWRQPQGDYRR